MICAVAEFVGIGVAVLWYGAVASILGEPIALAPRVGVWLTSILAAVPEGLVLGGMQGWWLSRVWPVLSMRRWIGATITVGAVGWAIGTFIPLFMFPGGGETAAPPQTPTFDPSLTATAISAAFFGAIIGSVFGLGQSLALPFGWGHRVDWIVANAVGWMVGLPLIYVSALVASDLSSWGHRIALWMSGGAGAGMAIGLATALAIQRMTRRA